MTYNSKFQNRSPGNVYYFISPSLHWRFVPKQMTSDYTSHYST